MNLLKKKVKIKSKAKMKKKKKSRTEYKMIKSNKNQGFQKNFK
jgi:hypothetical protein